MEVIRTLDITMDEMDAFIQEMVLKDIYQATGKKIKKGEVHPGYKYHKKLKGRNGREGKVVTKIEQLTSGNYSVSFSSSQGKNYLSYCYDEDDDKKVKLCYKESYDAKTKLQALNYKIMNFFYRKSNLKRIRLTLAQIEHLIQENRKPVK